MFLALDLFESAPDAPAAPAAPKPDAAPSIDLFGTGKERTLPLLCCCDAVCWCRLTWVILTSPFFFHFWKMLSRLHPKELLLCLRVLLLVISSLVSACFQRPSCRLPGFGVFFGLFCFPRVKG